MVAFLHAHPEVRCILVEKVDRLYRNLKDYQLLDELGVTIHFVKENVVISPDSRSNDRLIHEIKVVLAKKPREPLRGSEEGDDAEGFRRRVADVVAARVSQREGPRAEEGDRRHRARSGEGAARVDLFESLATGAYSLGDLVRHAKKIGLRGRYGAVLGKQSVKHILTTTAYTGVFTWSGVTYRGKYEPLVSPALFDTVQGVLSGATRPKAAKHAFLYSGMVRCRACDGLLAGQQQKGACVYYACPGAAKCKRYYPESLFEQRTIAILTSLTVDRAVSDWIVEELGHWHDAIATKGLDAAARLRKRLTDVDNLQAASYEEKLLGRVDEAMWRRLNEKPKDEAAGPGRRSSR